MSYKNITTKFLINTIVACCSAALTNFLYNYIYRERNEVIFFYGYKPICNAHYSAHTTTINTLQCNDCPTCNLHRLIGWLNEAKKTLDICMYTFSHELLSEVVIDAHKRGVCVRIIVNEDHPKTTWKMGTMGIAKKVKHNRYKDNLMHHKFIIIDNKKIILGSLNWTINAVRKNWENVFITNERDLINPFIQEFQTLWTQFN